MRESERVKKDWLLISFLSLCPPPRSETPDSWLQNNPTGIEGCYLYAFKRVCKGTGALTSRVIPSSWRAHAEKRPRWNENKAAEKREGANEITTPKAHHQLKESVCGWVCVLTQADVHSCATMWGLKGPQRILGWKRTLGQRRSSPPSFFSFTALPPFFLFHYLSASIS